jgi:small subunit ribosomal protein S7
MSLKLFSKWEVTGIKIQDPGLQGHVGLNQTYVPKSQGRNITRLTRGKKNIVERLINKLMVPGHKGKKHTLTSGHVTGKYNTCYNIVEKSFSIIEKKLGKNPIEVFVTAVENAAPREEITTIEYGGARYPKAVECSPLRRIDIALRAMIQGSYGKSFNSKKSAAEALSDEIIAAYQLSPNSNAISKKNESERQADSSR